MATCPSGHESQTTDYCDECGARIGGVTVATRPVSAAPPAPAAAPGTPCPVCGTARDGDNRYCESCGYDFTSAPSADDPVYEAETMSSRMHPKGRPPAAPPAPEAEPTLVVPLTWRARIIADRAYYDSVLAENAGDDDVEVAPFPVYCPERSVVLDPAAVGDDGVRIGRRSRSRGVVPEIDLAGPPEDTGVSHLHAVLLPRPDGTWIVVDPGSTNGTLINDGTEPIRPNVAVPVKHGDRIHVGAWTTIVIDVS